MSGTHFAPCLPSGPGFRKSVLTSVVLSLLWTRSILGQPIDATIWRQKTPGAHRHALTIWWAGLSLASSPLASPSPGLTFEDFPLHCCLPWLFIPHYVLWISCPIRFSNWSPFLHLCGPGLAHLVVVDDFSSSSCSPTSLYSLLLCNCNGSYKPFSPG